MKKIGIVLAALTLTASAFGQGFVNFNNRLTSAGLLAPVYGVNSAAPSVRLSGNSSTNGGTVNYAASPLLSGAGFSATLWAGTGADSGEFQNIGNKLAFSSSTTLPGMVTGGGNTDTRLPAGAPANFQVRAWDNKGGTITTWTAALAAHQQGLTAAGWSDVFAATPSAPPAAPTALSGLRSFNLTIVPEPSLIALGALGFGALLLRRRK